MTNAIDITDDTLIVQVRGDKFFRIWDLDADKALAGGTARFVVRTTVDAPDPAIIDKSLTPGQVAIVSDTAGARSLSVTIPGTELDNELTPGQVYAFAFHWTYSDTDGPFVIDMGRFVTRKAA